MNPSLLTGRLVENLLRVAPADQATRAITGILREKWGPAAFEVADGLAQAIESADLAPEYVNAIENAAAAVDGATALFLQAWLLQARQRLEPAIDLLAKAASLGTAGSPAALVTRARLLAGLGRLDEAGHDLRTAYNFYPPYSLLTASERILRKVLAAGQWQPRRKVRLALLGNSTTSFLAAALLASGFREGLAFEVYQCPFGQYQQDILDPQSGFHQFTPDVTVILLNHRDACLQPAGSAQQTCDFVRQVRQSWSAIRDRHACHIIQAGLNHPPPGAWGCLEDTLPDGRNRLVTQINQELSSDLPSGVSFLGLEGLAYHAEGPFFSDAEWQIAKQYPASAATAVMADAICAQCLAVCGLSCKAIILDLDNTLWGGIIGEDGLQGIRIGPPSPAGEGYLELQRYLKDLQQRGVLLAVCSKNNPEDAQTPFQQHEAMILKLEDFVSFSANWQDKASNILSMANDLSLGLDSFTFLDDSPAERAMIRAQLPQARVPECGTTPQEMLRVLRRGMFFESLRLTAEDVERHASYRANVERRSSEKVASSLDEFLAQLDLRAQHGAVDARTLARVTQLINKTNQFNLTSKRYTEEQVRSMMTSPDWWCRWFRLADRFGDYGLVGVMLVHKGQSAWDVDTWLLSCRALGKQMEQFMCLTMLQAARSAGASEVHGHYIPTARNAQVQDIYPRLGFTEIANEPEEIYAFDLNSAALPRCPHVTEMHPI